MFRLRTLLVFVGLAGAALGAFLLTRGGDETPPSQQTLVPFAEFRAIRLDTPRETVTQRFGRPLRVGPAGALDPGATCLFYSAPSDAAPATEYQFCFVGGKLHSKFAG